ncbi:NACHT domain-containing protein [Streptomyces sp. S.PNR 29]|uniref:NACHT domain-containing protein n=1 Tax=Streptomyces sp. S.PNR 29 TaxID=2973805 RepID=UPI0025AF8FAC|nr:NACHT domain-containing protein [Streptomyces sp. S.PNR 29]MDN0194182.1 LpqB family beta-propeller domain-containing protein [Streptomyces sp. S.PNR 29]
MSRERGRDSSRGDGLVAVLAVDTYDNPAKPQGREVLRHIGAVSGRFATIAQHKLGFGKVLSPPPERTREGISAWLDAFLDRPAERKILYWTGHGVDDPEGFHLACQDSWADGPFDPARSFALTELVDRLLDERNQAHTLLILDACSSHGHLPGALHRAVDQERLTVGHAHRTRSAGFEVIGTSGVGETIREGMWMRWLTAVLDNPDLEVADHSRPLNRLSLYFPVPYLVMAVDQEAAAEGLETADERPGHVVVRPLPNSFLHNPYFDGDDPDRDARWARQAVLADDAPPPWTEEAHFGLEEGGVLEREFTGRQAALSRLVRWLDTVPHGMQVVTGPGGSGKTALLGRLALLSVARRRRRLDPQPPPQICPRPGTVHALVTCRDTSLGALVGAVWDALTVFGTMPDRPDATADPAACAAAVGELARREGGALNLVFDGLDEAMPGQAHEIARHLLNRLAETPGVKVVVSTRPRPRRELAQGAPGQSLLEVLDTSAPPLALDEDDDTERDITAMAEAVLAAPRSPYAGDRRAAQRAEAAQTIAEESGRLFLVARLIAGQLVREQRLPTQEELASRLREAGTGLETWVRRELAYLEGDDGAGQAVRALAPLALAHGGGVRDLGLLMAMAGALSGGSLSGGAAREVLTRAEGGLVSVESGTYRLAHAGFGAHVLQRAGLSPQEGHRRLHDALRARCGGDWTRADDYTRSFLAVHAAQAGADRLRELLDDPEFLVHTDPDSVLPLATAQVRECDGAALYVRVADAFRIRRDPAERRALLRAAAFVHHRSSAYRRMRGPGFERLPWTEEWTDARPLALDLRWPTVRGGARALHWSAAAAPAASWDGALSAAGPGAVVVHHPETGKLQLTRRPPDRRRVLTKVTDALVGGRRVTAAGDRDEIVLWDDQTAHPAQVFHWGGASDSLTVEECGNRALLMAADGRRVWAWQWDAGGSVSHAVLADVTELPADRIALVSLGARHFLLAAGHETVLYEVHPRGDRLLGARRVLRAGTRPARAAAALADGTKAWLACTDGRTATVWRLTPADGGPQIGEVLSVPSPARGLALGRWGDRPLLVLHEDHQVVVHGITHDVAAADRDSRLCVFPVTGHRHGGALACDPAGTGRIAVADGPDVRILDVASAARAHGEGLRRGHTERLMVELAAGRPGTPPLLCRVAGGLVVATGTEPDGTGRAAELHHDGLVTAVRALWHDDRWLVATACGRTVRVWSLTEDLAGHRAEQDIPLKGDAGDLVRGLELVLDGAGVPSLFFSDSREVVCRRLRDGRWEVSSSLLVMAHALRVRTFADGRTCLVVDTGRGFRMWEPDGEGWRELLALDDRGRRTAAVALGEHHLLGTSVPLLAWAEDDQLAVARRSGRRWVRDHVRHDGGAPTALTFSGSPQRPLLLVCGGARTLSVYDATTWRPLGGAVVPWRGLDVEAAAALFQEPYGIALALQGRQRCDRILLRAEALEHARGGGGGAFL